MAPRGCSGGFPPPPSTPAHSEPEDLQLGALTVRQVPHPRGHGEGQASRPAGQPWTPGCAQDRSLLPLDDAFRGVDNRSVDF